MGAKPQPTITYYSSIKVSVDPIVQEFGSILNATLNLGHRSQQVDAELAHLGVEVPDRDFYLVFAI
jgi:hypothetical protein